MGSAGGSPPRLLMDATDHYRLSLLNWFTDESVSRLSVERRDAAWIAERLADPGSAFLPVWRSRNLFRGSGMLQPVVLEPQRLPELPAGGEPPILLGVQAGRTYFAVEVSAADPEPARRFGGDAAFHDLRQVGHAIDRGMGALLAYARAMVYWHRHHRFCGDCGSATRSEEGGHVRVCLSAACGRYQYPRTDPAIIVLVSDGEACLLGRQRAWPRGRYSTIAGFVEPGESAEQAVVREVLEETAVSVRQVRYHSSQPWPFPGSLMLGFHATAERTPVRLHDGELEDARWLTREELAEAVTSGRMGLPTPVSIAWRLVEDWYDAGADAPLAGLAASPA